MNAQSHSADWADIATELQRHAPALRELAQSAVDDPDSTARQELRTAVASFDLPPQVRDTLARVFLWDGPLVMSPNQVVALRLRLARHLRGWTQEQAAEHLEPHIGRRWSRASFSAAERSVDTGRRQFTADDLVAFSRTFRMPLAFFLEPPDGVLISERPGASMAHPARPLTRDEYTAVLGIDEIPAQHPTAPIEPKHVAALASVEALTEAIPALRQLLDQLEILSNNDTNDD